MAICCLATSILPSFLQRQPSFSKLQNHQTKLLLVSDTCFFFVTNSQLSRIVIDEKSLDYGPATSYILKKKNDGQPLYEGYTKYLTIKCQMTILHPNQISEMGVNNLPNTKCRTSAPLEKVQLNILTFCKGSHDISIYFAVGHQVYF